MKNRVFIVLMCVFSFALSSCSKSEPVEEWKRWDCSVVCAEEADSNSYVITYSDETVISSTGILTFDNRNDFDICVHLLADGKERFHEIGAYGVSGWYQIEKGIEYTVGCHADVAEGTEIQLMVYDGEGNPPWVP